jgi:DNA topoisomerase-1
VLQPRPLRTTARSGARRRSKRQTRPLDHVESARSSGLRYVSASDPGIRRKGSGCGFSYFDSGGNRIKTADELRRFRSLVIPPAWKDVWICSYATGHLQAVGRDQKGRKQYRYHPDYRAIRNQTKFDRLTDFAAVLPQIRRKVKRDLAGPELSKHKIVAAVVYLLESTAIRVGNAEYERQNGSFGLTTLRNRHVKVEAGTIRFRFPAKSGQIADTTLNDPRLARIVRKCQNLPGQNLFGFVDDLGEPCKISSEDVNEYLREASGEDFTAKDFRTWIGTVEMVQALAALGPAETATEAKQKVVEANKSTAAKLANRPATCRAYYVHPAVIEAYLDGSFFDTLGREDKVHVRGLSPEEHAALRLIRSRPL